MDAGETIVFTTEQVAALVGLPEKDKWRVIKFAQSEEYGIQPSVSEAEVGAGGCMTLKMFVRLRWRSVFWRRDYGRW